MFVKVLTQPHVPLALHGVNPRTILGKEWWDRTRKKVYKINNYKCAACGIHKQAAKRYKWLECHEYWDINYKTGICEVKGLIPLCHYCHNFIHSGRLQMISGVEKTEVEVKEILQHGFDILKDYDYEVFIFTYHYAKHLGIDTYNLRPYSPDVNPMLCDDDICMKLGNNYYRQSDIIT